MPAGAAAVSSRALLSTGVVADDREEDLLQARLLLDVLDLGGRHQRLELGERAVHDDPALVEDPDPVGELLGLLQVLRGEQHGRAARASSLTACHTAMRACGSSPAVGSSRKMTGGFPIRLIAMSRRRRMPPEYVAARREPASVSENRSSRSSAMWPGSVEVPQLGDEHQVLPPGEDLVHGGELSGQADRLAYLRRLRGDVEAVDGGRPRIRLEQRGEDPDDRGLARPVGAEQGEDAAPRHVEVDAAQHRWSP